ncbi:uncharacterized protein HaLaN_10674 [Haematococcus lacustris]|uniref:Uncharacterized protein n=1 Tax=Haematococcus lacustris TaxID=44745 RepID=A0A699Z5G4_HAELA|nr:uncharacterized protein HaLaN_10674 [Haematococcus lacustris]
MLMPVFEDPSNQALLAKLQELGSIDLRGDNNTIGAHSMQLAVTMGIAEQREFVFNAATQIGVGIDPGITQAVSAASGVWDQETGQLVADHLDRWKLTKGQHLAAASSAGTSLVANLKHTTVTLATWDAVWEVYLDPKWARQRLRLYGAQDRALEQFFKKKNMAEVSMERHGRAKQLVVFFGAAGTGTGGRLEAPSRAGGAPPVASSMEPAA